MVNARRGVSRSAVVDWVVHFVDTTDPKQACALVGSVIDDLCEMQDIGYGKMRGEPVLVVLPKRLVALPDRRIIALGDHGLAMDAGGDELFPVVDEVATETLIDFLAACDDHNMAIGSRALTSVGRWTGKEPISPSLRRALLLCGTFDPVEQKWSTSHENASFLNEWFNLASAALTSDSGKAPDESQLRVVNAPARLRLVVEAGPGTGKTHVACERVISLVRNEALAPSRILLLSFTRIAVAELRDRVLRHRDNSPNMGALQIRTFDSFAARLLANAGTVAAGGFDASIRAATKLMRSDNPVVENAIDQLEHVIIDEAQDLTGDRKELCEALVALLHPTCGVTVFGDFAQAIYGFQRRGKSGATFLAEILRREGFTSDQLERDHRTKTGVLREMFSSVRESLRDETHESREGYFRVRDQINGAAVESGISSFAVHPSTTRGLILTRSRRSLVTAAEEMRASGRNFRLRLTGRPTRVDPWVGALLGGHPASQRLSRDTFQACHEALGPAVERDAEECWAILLDLDGSGREFVSAGHVADGLAEPPLDLLVDHEGTSGPLLSTIHAIKGREAERAMLLLSRAPHGDTLDWGEEARALYVGATRASLELRTGWVKQRKFRAVGTPRRLWSARPDHRLIEIGIEGDLVDWHEFCRSGHVTNGWETVANIWQAAVDLRKAKACPDAEGRFIVRTDECPESAIGCLSGDFLETVQEIRKAGTDAGLPELISDISVVGATTVVVPGRSGESSSLSLMPLLGGFARVLR